MTQDVIVSVDGLKLAGALAVPEIAQGLVILAHGSGSSRHNPRNRYVASALQKAGLATLLVDLLTPREERIDDRTMKMRFDIPLLTDRLVGTTDWAHFNPMLRHLPIGYFGAGTDAAAALVAATERAEVAHAIVSWGGRPDLAGTRLSKVHAATLFIVASADTDMLALNWAVYATLRRHTLTQLEVVPGAADLFPEPTSFECVAGMAADWFARHLSEHRAAA